jgi:hypothetical protein
MWFAPIVPDRVGESVRLSDVLATTETTPLYAFLLIVHVLISLVGLVQVGVSYAELRRVEATRDGANLPASTTQYFASPAKWFSRILILVPVTGGALLAASNGKFHATALWVMLSGALWFCAFGLLEGGVFASERSVAAALREGVVDQSAARKGRIAATGVLSLVGLAAVLMVLQPGG